MTSVTMSNNHSQNDSRTTSSTSSSPIYSNTYNVTAVDQEDIEVEAIDNDDGVIIDQPEIRSTSTSTTALFELSKLPREVRNLLAGGVAGMVAKSVVAPVDRIKILYQTSSMKFSLQAVPKVAYSIIKKEGISALWKGNTATMIRVFPYSGIQFMVFDRCKHYFLKHKNIPTDQLSHYTTDKTISPAPAKTTATTDANAANTDNNQSASFTNTSTGNNYKLAKRRFTRKYALTPIESLIAGSIAGAVSVTCTYPLDLTRAQLAVMKKHGKDGIKKNYNFIDVLKQNYYKGGGNDGTGKIKKGSIKGLFRGIQPTLLGILPYSGAAFMINEQSKQYISKKFQREPSNIEKMQCGALSGLCAQTLTYPFEVTRRRMQTIGIIPNKEAAQTSLLQGQQQQQVGVNAATASSSGSTATKVAQQQTQRAPSMISTMKSLWIEQGISGFFKGVSMNWLKGPIAFSISFTTFDIVKNMIDSNSNNNSTGSSR